MLEEYSLASAVTFSFFSIHPFQGNATLHLYPHFKALQDIEGKISLSLFGILDFIK